MLAFSVASPSRGSLAYLARSSHVLGDILHMQLTNGQFWGDYRFLGRPYQRRLLVARDADDILEQLDEVIVDADGVWLQRLSQLPVLDEVGIADDCTGEIARAQPVDRISVPNTPDVEPCPHTGEQLLVAQLFLSLDHHIGGEDTRPLAKTAPLTAEAKAIAWQKGAHDGLEFLGRVVVGEETHQHTAFDQIRAAGRQSLAGHPL